jgi:tetratricopeptide (TPR) repeat protein
MSKRAWIFSLTAAIILLSSCSNSGESNYRTGMEHYRKAEYTEAVSSLESAIAFDKSDPGYYIGLAMSYLELGEYETALSEMAYALQLDPASQDAYRCQGIIYIAMNDFQNAINSLNTALSLAEGFVGEMEYDILDYRAVAELKSGQYTDAIRTYTILLEVGYHKPEHYYLRGGAYLAVGSMQAGLADYEESIGTATSGYKRYLDIFMTLMEYGYEEDATSYLEKALQLNLGKNEDYFLKGQIYYYLGDFPNAISNLSAAQTEGNPEASLYLGKLYAASNDTITAFTMFRNYLDSNPASGEAYNQLGLIRFQEGAYQEALSYFQAGLDANDFKARKPLLYNEAVTYEYLLDFETAKQKMAAYVNAYPDDADAQREYIFLKTR